MTGGDDFLQEWRDRPPTGERYKPSFDPGLVQYVDYGSSTLSGAPRVVVFIDDFNLGPAAFDSETIATLFGDERAGLWLTPSVTDRLGERARKNRIRDLLTGNYLGLKVDLGLLVETNAPGLWHAKWRQVRRGEPEGTT